MVIATALARALAPIFLLSGRRVAAVAAVALARSLGLGVLTLAFAFLALLALTFLVAFTSFLSDDLLAFSSVAILALLAAFSAFSLAFRLNVIRHRFSSVLVTGILRDLGTILVLFLLVHLLILRAA